MSAVKNLLSYVKRLSIEHETWQIALRSKSEIPLYKGNGDGFILVPNSSRYWRADPFVFKYNKKNYLFAELFDRKKNKGVIGVARIKNNKCGKFRICLNLEQHLSYPCIYENAEGIFMIPECSESGEINIYRSVDFPLKWEKYKTLCSFPAVDTTPIFNENKQPIAYLTSKFEPVNGGNDNLFGLSCSGTLQEIYTSNTSCRCAGHFIKDENLIRPIQDDSGVYGNSMYFSRVNNYDITGFSEHYYLHVLPPESICRENEVSISLCENKKDLTFIGVHTYNMNEDYEVIDLLVESQTNAFVLKKNKNKLFNKYIKKLKR